MIHLSSTSDVYAPRYLWIWLLAAFKAGFINSAGFLATGSFVSHVTGFGTQVGIALGHNEYLFGAEILIIPIAFIFGGVITSLILDGHKDSTKPPPYYIVQALITLSIAGVLIIGESGIGDFPSTTPQPSHYGWLEISIITMLCFICGLKNSLVTWTTKGKVRVTHLTGLSTDIGLNLLKMVPSKNNPYYVKGEGKSNLIRIITFASFFVGACSSAIIFPQVGYKGFFIVMTISLVLTCVSFMDRRRIAQAHKQELTPRPAPYPARPNVHEELSMANSTQLATNEPQASGMISR